LGIASELTWEKKVLQTDAKQIFRISTSAKCEWNAPMDFWFEHSHCKFLASGWRWRRFLCQEWWFELYLVCPKLNVPTNTVHVCHVYFIN